ncbi:endonuclease III [Candidatus Poribacteria bacterium]|nr:MAG: endonuclease III [Candidatus Poribacteria bacterium]
MEAREKVERMVDELEKLLGVPDRPARDPLDCLIKTILSQNTSDVNTDRAFQSLKSRFPGWEDLLEADEEEIADAIRIGGLSRQKSRVIKGLLRRLKELRGELSLDFLSEMGDEEAIEFLTGFKGVGLKTAYVVMAFAFGRDVFPVDTHILRISKRVGLIPQNCSAEKAHELLNPLIPEGKSYSFHINLIRFGRTICKAKNPRCDICPLYDICDWEGKTGKGG